MFANINVANDEIISFFRSTAAELTDLGTEVQPPSKEGDIRFINDLTAFRRHPLVYTRQEKDFAALLDFHFLGEKLSQGLYHTVLDCLDGEEPDRTEFLRRYWGEVFEIYINDRMRDVFPIKSRQFFCSPSFDFDKGFQAFDGALVLGSDLIVIEYKGKYLTLDAKYEGDKSILRRRLEEKFGKGVEQLTRNIEMVFHLDESNRRTFSEYLAGQPINTFDHKRIKRVRRVYPIIVVQDCSLQLGFANWNLRDALSAEVEKRPISPALVRPLTIMTAEDLESVLTYRKEVPLQNILEYHARKLEPIYSFKFLLNKYLALRGVRRRPNPGIQERIEDIITTMRAMFHTID